MDYRQINWIASYPKSGNTWVRCFLEAYFTGSVDINQISISVQDDVAAAYQTGHGTEMQKAPIDIQQLARPMALLRMVERYAMSDIKVPLFVKTHSPNVCCNGIEMLPRSLTRSTIYIVRDPRAILPSFAKHMGVSMDKACEQMTDKYRTLNATEVRMADYLGDWNQHIHSFSHDDAHNTLFVRYEDLRSNPRSEFCRILKHLSISPVIDRVDAAIEAVELDKLKKQEEKKGFIESSIHAKDKFFGTGEIDGWKDKLSIKQKNFIESKMKIAMKKFGYLKKGKKAA